MLLTRMFQTAIDSVEDCINFAELNGLTDTQEFIEWECKISELACKEHPENRHPFEIQHLKDTNA